jgi:hypothetical protein
MTSDDILPMIKNAAATYNLVGKYTVHFSGAGDSFSEFDASSAYCIHCEAEADYYNAGLYGSSTRPIAHTPECPCSKDAVLAAEFEQQAIDVITYESVRKESGKASRNRWVTKDELLFQIMDFDGRADFNNDGSTGSISIDFCSALIEIEVSVNEMISTDLGMNSYDSASFDAEDEDSESLEETSSLKVDIDALGDFKEWLGPAN